MEKGPGQTFFFRKDIQVSNKYMKRVQHPQLSGKCKLKPQRDITSYFLGQLILKNEEIVTVGEAVEEGNPCELLLRMQISTTVIGTQDGRSLKKVKSNYLYLTISILSLYPQETIPVSQIDIYTSIFIHYSIIHNSRDMEKTSVSINR